jgi:flagellar biosynthesis protein FlhF
VPFLAANAAEDLLKVHETFRGTELVLIDTAGISPKNKSGIQALAAIKNLNLPIDFHLCLSSTESQSQLDNEVRSFLSTGLSSLVFSKLDESWAYGEIFNLSKTWSLPLSFFSIGQQIPDDIERATRERVIERIFGL